MMRRSARRVGVPCWVLALALSISALGAEDPGERDFFESKVRPVLAERCYPCHSSAASKSKGGLRLDDRAAARAGGDSGPAVVPGRPDDSLLILAVERGGELSPMPPKTALPAAETADLRRWIERGAFDPRDGSDATPVSTADWWSLTPIERPTPPTLDVEGRAWSRNPIDAFLLDRLRREGLGHSPEADRRTLIRRLTFDLLGLPPTPEEIDAFVADPAATPTSGWSTACSPARITANAGPGGGWTWLTSPRPTATIRTASGPTPGLIATISSSRSTTTFPMLGSSASRSPPPPSIPTSRAESSPSASSRPGPGTRARCATSARTASTGRSATTSTATTWSPP